MNRKPLASILILLSVLVAMAGPCRAATVNANFTSAATVPVTAAAYTASGDDVEISLGFTPATGTTLTVVKNTGSNFIGGQFSNLAQGQTVTLQYNGVPYRFVANYYGGSGNDLVLQWKHTSLFTWGYNHTGQLGIGTTTVNTTPTLVSRYGALVGRNITSMVAGGSHNLALCADGFLAAWGDNTYGQIGNGSAANFSANPTLLNDSGVLVGRNITAIAAGSSHSLALCADGMLAAWGLNDSGQLGTGSTTNSSTTNSSTPVSVNQTGVLAGRSITAIAAGSDHNLALCSNGSLVAWGRNTSGQLGNNSTTSSSTPVSVIVSGVLAGKTITAIAAGATHSVVLCSDGTLATWGYNGFGQLGNGSSTYSSIPVLVNRTGVLAGKTVVAIAARGDFTLVLCSDGTLAAWGANGSGQLGNGSTANSSTPVLVNQTGVLAGKSVVAIAAGSSHGTALCADGTLAAWGPNFYGQLGNGSTTDSSIPVLVNQTGVLAGKSVVAIAAGGFHNHAICADGTLAAWGKNDYGQFGGGSSGNNAVPVPVDQSGVLVGKTITAVSSGSSHCLALCAENKVVAWGYNAYGQLGNGSTTTSSTPVLVNQTGVLAGKTIIAVTAGSSHSLALCSDGTLAAWGYNAYGQLGNGSTTNSPTPVLVDQSGVLAGKTIRAVAAGGDFTLVLCTDGTLAAWGYNNSGRLGDGSITNRSSPVLVFQSGALAGKFVVAIAAGYTHCLALCADGTLAAWGNNSGGQLGNYRTTNSSTPDSTVGRAEALAGKSVTAMAAGYLYSLALCADGTLAAWGNNSAGQLGTGSTTTVAYPVPVNQSGVLANKNITTLASCYGHNLALCADGTLASWGYNIFGQLGIGTISNSSNPAVVNQSDVLAGKTVTALATGGYHSLALVATPSSSDSALVGLTIGSASLNPAYVPTMTSYTSVVADNVTSITVTPVVMDDYATVTVNGSPVASGTESQGIPLVAGPNVVTVQVSAEDGINRTTYTVTVTRADSYQAWMESEFPLQADRDNPMVSGPTATPANDGISNLMKYALALAPMAPGTAFLPSTGEHDGYMTLTYRKNKQASNLSYTVEATGSLAESDWLPATAVVSIIDDGDHWLVTIKDNVPQTAQASRFMRLKIEE